MSDIPLKELGESILTIAKAPAQPKGKPVVRIPDELLPYLVEANTKHGMGCRRLAEILKRKGIDVSHSTVARAIKNHQTPVQTGPDANAPLQHTP